MWFESLGAGIQDLPLPEEIKIEVNKRMGKMIKEAGKRAKNDKCYYCKKQVSSFCNSHNVPAFCLRNIGIDGEVYYSNTLINVPYLKDSSGINASGTFHLICKECDNTIFQEYENPDIYTLSPPSSKILAEIAMKGYLKLIYKRKLEKALYDVQEEEFPFMKSYLDYQRNINNLDSKNYIRNYEKAQRLSKKDNNDGYYLLFYKLLDYVTPIAFQCPVALAVDFNGDIVNDIYNLNPSYKLEDLQICVFPLEKQTAVIMFIDNDVKRYKNFYRQFNKLDETDQLGVINYIIFMYSEDYFFCKELKNKCDLNVIKETARLTPNLWKAPSEDAQKLLGEKYNLTNWTSFPNFLSKDFHIEKL